MKIKNGVITPVAEAVCLDCSTYLIRLRSFGVIIRELILLHQDKDGEEFYGAWTIDEFYKNSLRGFKIK